MHELDTSHPTATETLRGRVLLACTFRLGEQWFGVDARWVQEINTHTIVTPIPHAPSAVRGYVNLRGHLRLVLDLRDILGTSRPAGDGQQRLIVFKPTAGESFAILVDQVGDIVSVACDQIDRPASAESHGGESRDSLAQQLLAGYAKLEHQLVALLDPRRFLTTAIHV